MQTHVSARPDPGRCYPALLFVFLFADLLRDAASASPPLMFGAAADLILRISTSGATVQKFALCRRSEIFVLRRHYFALPLWFLRAVLPLQLHRNLTDTLLHNRDHAEVLRVPFRATAITPKFCAPVPPTARRSFNAPPRTAACSPPPLQPTLPNLI